MLLTVILIALMAASLLLCALLSVVVGASSVQLGDYVDAQERQRWEDNREMGYQPNGRSKEPRVVLINGEL